MDRLKEQQQHLATLSNSPLYQRQKLVRCSVSSNSGEDNIRIVELENFRLWEYLMTNKHGLTVSDLYLCLWVSDYEYQQRQSIYTHAGATERVNRIVVDLYDEEYGFTNTINRFAPESDTDKVVSILTSHIPKPMHSSGLCNIEVVEGYSIEQHKHLAKRPFLMGFDMADPGGDN